MSARRRPSLLSPLALARRKSVRQGFLGGDRTWMVIGAMVWVPRLLRRLFGRTSEVVASEVLQPGERLVLTTIPRQTREQRRALKR